MRVPLYPGRIEIWSAGFFRERKTRDPEEKASEQGENQLGQAGIETGSDW